MTNDNQQWTKLFRYLDQRFDTVDRKFDTVDARFDHLYSLHDSYLKRQETDEHERAAMNVQLARHESWIFRLANKLGVKLAH